MIGVLISFGEPTKKMRADAASAGVVETAWGKHPKLQLLTVAELLNGKGVDYPRTSGINKTFKTAPKVVRERAKQLGVFDTIVRPDPTPAWLKEDDELAVLKDDDE